MSVINPTYTGFKYYLHGLDNAEFFEKYKSGEFVNLDMPAKEYLVKRPLVSADIERRMHEEAAGPRPSSYVTSSVEEKQLNVTPWLIAYGHPGSEPYYQIVWSDEEKDTIVRDYRTTGKFTAFDFSKDIEEECSPEMLRVYSADVNLRKKREIVMVR